MWGHALFVTTIIQLPLFSDIANYKKEIRIAKYSMRGDVCGHVLSPPLSIRGRDANRQFLRNAWYTCAIYGGVQILVRGPPLKHVSAYPLRQQRVVCCFTCCLRYAKIRFTYRCVLCTWVKTVRGTHVHDREPRLGYPQHLLSKTVHSFTHETQAKRRSKEGGELQATLRDMWRKS